MRLATLLKKYYRFPSVVYSVGIATNIVLLFSVFTNSPVITVQNDKYHYMIDRGLPSPWAGYSALDKPVPFPIVKMPMLVRSVGNRQKAIKVVNVYLFAKYVATMMLITYPISYVLFRTIEENKKLKVFGNVFTLVLIILFVILYDSALGIL